MYQWVDVLGLCVRVSSWANLSGSCLGPSDNYRESPLQYSWRTGENHNPWSVPAIIESRMNSPGLPPRGWNVFFAGWRSRVFLVNYGVLCTHRHHVYVTERTYVVRPSSLPFLSQRAGVYRCCFCRCGNCDTKNVFWEANQVATAQKNDRPAF